MLDKKTHKVAIIIPSYNETKNLKKVLVSLKNKYNIILVDDGSNDKTNFQSFKNKNTSVLKHKYNQGYDAALTTGFKYAYKKKYDFAISFDADNQFYTSDLKKFIKEIIHSNYNLIIGEREKFQRLGENLSGFLFGLRFNIKDPFCGLKIYRIDKLSKKKFFELEKKKFYGLQFLKAYTISRKYKCFKIRTKPRRGNPRLQNSIFVNLKMIYATLFLLIKTINYK